MLARHSAVYVLSRGIPGAVLFFTIVLFTRLVTPGDYGTYALVIAGVNAANVIVFQWLKLGLLRFYPSYETNPVGLKATIITYFILLTAVAVTVGGAIAVVVGQPDVVVLGTVLLVGQAWFELNLELARAGLRPVLYGILNLSKAVIALALGGYLAWFGWGAVGLVMGGVVGVIIPGLASTIYWKGTRPSLACRNIRNDLLRYGIPLSATFALGFIVGMSDRFMIAWLIGKDAAGLYSVGYDLPRQSMGMVMMIINLAAFPLAVRAVESGDQNAVDELLSSNVVALLAVSVPLALMFIILSENIGYVAIGSSFSDAATKVLPWIALGALLEGTKSYYLDHSFHLGKRTGLQVIVTGLTAMVNVALNFCLIPLLGLIAAAYSTVASFAIAITLSWILGRRAFRIPFPVNQVIRIAVCSAGMSLVLMSLANERGLLPLVGQITTGLMAYIALIVLLDVGGVRSRLLMKVLRFGVNTPRTGSSR